jgi:hypothetical protein
MGSLTSLIASGGIAFNMTPHMWRGAPRLVASVVNMASLAKSM